MRVGGESDKDYAGYLAMQKLVQACGRGMRGPEDWCETLIIDDTFADYFFKYNRKHSPRWFQDAVEYVDVFPEPL
jgi:Rad3-related DNA helicase